jgi:hypothetical protein
LEDRNSSRTATAFDSSTHLHDDLIEGKGFQRLVATNHCRQPKISQSNGERMTQRRIRSVALLVFAFASPALFAQILQIHAYSTSDGLPQSEIVSIYQDRAGYIWLGTYEYGLARYDGRTFERFAGPPA